MKNKDNKNVQKYKPILKWAGGKTQLLEHLLPKIPKEYNKYIEPFFGGGALFFALKPNNSIIADSNPELINLYRVIAKDVNSLISELKNLKNEKDFFYDMRRKEFSELSEIAAAARTIFLNKTAFNGLYRVNKKGQFNVPFGYYKNPKILDEDQLLAASKLLKKTKILLGDFKDVLCENAKKGDFIFLDPPYLPVSKFSDFKRYTKEQFHEKDQISLANLVNKLSKKGCHILLTNSNHPLIHELYKDFNIDIYKTKRNINSKSTNRKGEDIIVSNFKKRISFANAKSISSSLSDQMLKFPTTRYMGSKNKILPYIRDITREFDFSSAIDLFSGSGIVSYMLKSEGKSVISNDYMALGSTFSKALIENNSEILPLKLAKKLLCKNEKNDKFVQSNFKDLYFTDEENILIDNIRANIRGLRNPYKKALALSALCRACTKKRPRGIFTYTGNRYDDGRKDLKTSIEDHFINAVDIFNNAVFDNKKINLSIRKDAMDLTSSGNFVYMDPPYYSLCSDNEYIRRYHFTEGICCNWEGVEMQWHTKTKKFKNYPTPFSHKENAKDAFDKLFDKYKKSIILVSYSSNCLPTLDEMVEMLAKYKKDVKVLSIDYRYSFANQKENMSTNKNTVKEYLFLGF